MARIDAFTPQLLPSKGRALVLVKKNWTDAEWEVRTDLRAEQVTVASEYGGETSALISRPYAPRRKAQEDKDFIEYEPLDLRGYWIRIKLLTSGLLRPRKNERVQPTTIFMGRVEKRLREVGGGDVENADGEAAPQGLQRWVVAGPGRLLEKMDIWESVTVEGTKRRLGRVLSFNLINRAAKVIGNRSIQRLPGLVTDPFTPDAYFFQAINPPAEIWTSKDAIEYLLVHFANQADKGGVATAPVWRIAGDRRMIEQLADFISTRAADNVHSLISRAIPAAYGLDWQIVPIADDDPDRNLTAGFEIQVFTGLGETIGFGRDETRFDYLANENKVTIDVGDDITIENCNVEETDAQAYDRFRAVGARMLICLSFGDGAKTKLVKGWSDALELDYKVGSGGTAEENDAQRALDRHRDTFQTFLLSGFNWQEDDKGHQRAVPYIGLDGIRNRDKEEEEGASRKSQTDEQSMMRQLPLLEGGDYTTDPPTNLLDTADFLPTVVFCKHVGDSAAVLPLDNLSTKSAGKMSDISVSVMGDRWGVRLGARPNHALAKADWGGAKKTNYNPTTKGKGLNWRRLICTIAVEADHRLTLGMELPDKLKSGSGFTKTISVPSAQLWFLAPETIVDVSLGGVPIKSPVKGVILRNDAIPMARIMAGGIARYQRERHRASITWRRLQVMHALIGRILEAVVEGGDNHKITAPITQVSWDFVRGTTTLRTGQAIK